MKKFTLSIIIIILFLIFFIKIPKYRELNNLIIVDKIYITCNNNYTIYLREIIPIKEDNGITYEYKIYKGNNNNLSTALKNIKRTNKNIYLNKVKNITTNCNNINKLFNKKIKKKSLNKINKELRKIS